MGNFDIGRKYLTNLYREKAGDNLEDLRKKTSDKKSIDDFLKKYGGNSMNGKDIERKMVEYLKGL